MGLGARRGGGPYRWLSALLGLVGAQPYILESKLFPPREALELGLVHELVPDAAGLRPAALAWIEKHAGSAAPAHQPWDDKNYKMPGGTPSNPKIAGMLSVAPAVLKQKTRGLYPAPEYALAAMVEGAQVDFDTALRIESRYLAKLIVSPVAKNMINTFFFNMNAIKSGQVTYDLARQMPRSSEVSTSAFGDRIIAGMKSYGRAPTFLLLTGYEQVRSVVCALVGDEEGARKAAEGVRNVEFVEGDLAHLPFEAGSFDLVLTDLGRRLRVRLRARVRLRVRRRVRYDGRGGRRTAILRHVAADDNQPPASACRG